MNGISSTATISLHEAARRGLLTTVKRLISSGADVNKKMGLDKTPLHEASENRHTKVVRELLNNNAEINAKMRHGTTPLHFAAMNGHLELVKLLVRNGACVKARMHRGKTPLKLAANFSHVEDFLKDFTVYSSESKDEKWLELIYAIILKDEKKVKFLLENNSDIVHIESKLRRTPLHVAVKNGNLKIVKLLTNAGADLNAKKVKGLTPLHVATKPGHTAIVKHLKNAGADINARMIYGITPLHMASKSGHSSIVNYLIGSGADINATTSNGCTPLHFAIRHGHSQIFRELINSSSAIDYSAQRIGGITPLFEASLCNQTEQIEILIKKSPDINHRADCGRTPIFFAIENDNLKILNDIISFGAELDINVNSHIEWNYKKLSSSKVHFEQIQIAIDIAEARVVGSDLSGMTPLQLAIDCDNIEAVKTLIKAGVDVNAKGVWGWTPLLWATLSGNVEIIRSLIEAGADVNPKLSLGWTPLHCAVSSENFNATKELVKAKADALATDIFGNSPLGISKSKKNTRLTNLMNSNNFVKDTKNLVLPDKKEGHEYTDLIFNAVDAILIDWQEVTDID